MNGMAKNIDTTLILSQNGDRLIEIKGYWTPQVQAKIDVVKDKRLTVLYYADLEPMMEYIDLKYKTTHSKKRNNYYILYDN